MASLHERCFHHPGREAAARCPSCGRYYCRECVTEHEGRVLCAACMTERKTAPRGRSARRLRRLLAPIPTLAALLLLWICFYALGRSLLAIPSAFHEGTVWEEAWEGAK